MIGTLIRRSVDGKRSGWIEGGFIWWKRTQSVVGGFTIVVEGDGVESQSAAGQGPKAATIGAALFLENAKPLLPCFNETSLLVPITHFLYAV